MEWLHVVHYMANESDRSLSLINSHVSEHVLTCLGMSYDLFANACWFIYSQHNYSSPCSNVLCTHNYGIYGRNYLERMKDCLNLTIYFTTSNLSNIYC